MGDKSGIAWTNATWNPIVGCTRVSPGCDNCYASTLHNQRYRANVKAALPWGNPYTLRQHGGTIAQFARSGGGIPLPTPPQQAAAYRNETPSGDPALDGCREFPR